jgi:hypothetical protein
MAVDASPYATLGIEPGADWSAVEQAYRQLIKRHHPDRAGGDAARAAEITRAYRELKRERADGKALVLVDEDLDAGASRWGGWMRAAVIGGAAALGALFASGPLAAWLDPPRRAVQQRAEAPANDPDGDSVMDGPLHGSMIDQAIGDAVRISRGRDEMALAAHSRDCHRQLRLQPSIGQFDRCAAFDDAVVEIQDRDPLRDQGPFGELAVTGRQMTAGTLLSNDYLAIDGRLDRVRLKVELALAPPLPPPVAPPQAVEANSEEAAD